MTKPISFDEVLDAVDALPEDAQAELVDVVRRRLAQRGRERVLEDVRQAREEYVQGKCYPTTPDDLMREIES